MTPVEVVAAQFHTLCAMSDHTMREWGVALRTRGRALGFEAACTLAMFASLAVLVWTHATPVAFATGLAIGLRLIATRREERACRACDEARGRALQMTEALEAFNETLRTARFRNEVKPCAPLPNGATQASRPPAGTKEWN